MNQVTREARAKLAHMKMTVLNIKLARRKAPRQPQAAHGAPRHGLRRMRRVVLTRDMLEAECRQRNAMELMRSQRERR